MIRSLLFTAILYVGGHPNADAYRPASFDVPMQGFYREVNQFAADTRRALNTLDDARSMRYLKPYFARMQSNLGG